MKIKSDKENHTTPSSLLQFWNLIIQNKILTMFCILLPVILYLLYLILPDDYIWFIIMSISFVFVVGIITNGQLFKHPTHVFFIFYTSLVLINLIWFYSVAIETEENRLNLKTFITKVSANEDKNNFNIDNKLPFESKINVTFNGNHRYDALFASKEHFDEFNITAIKRCNKYRIKSMSCEVLIEITHKDSSDILFSKELYNSVYPKKLNIERNN
jgi:hypothetical protein